VWVGHGEAADAAALGRAADEGQWRCIDIAAAATLQVARLGQQQGCTEALFTLGGLGACWSWGTGNASLLRASCLHLDL
jgi:hypothetical protein